MLSIVLHGNGIVGFTNEKRASYLELPKPASSRCPTIWFHNFVEKVGGKV